MLLLITTGVDFVVGLALENEQNERTRKAWLVLSLVTNLGVLAFFKYFNFFTDSFVRFSALFGLHPSPVTLKILLPMGISFYTFQALSYTIDVYRRELDTVHDPVRYFSFILFFPHLVAGPIVRARDLLNQFNQRRVFNPGNGAGRASPDAVGVLHQGRDRRQSGEGRVRVVRPSRIHVGMAAHVCDGMFRDPDLLRFRRLHAHRDRMRKASWHRAHEELRLPLFLEKHSGVLGALAHLADQVVSRVTRIFPSAAAGSTYRRWLLNILIVFLVSGFWHGANWTFVVWGLLHGVLYLAYSLAWPDSQRLAAETPGGVLVRPFDPVSASDRVDVLADVPGLGLFPRGVGRRWPAHREKDRCRTSRPPRRRSRTSRRRSGSSSCSRSSGSSAITRTPFISSGSHARSGGACTTRSPRSSSCSLPFTTRRSSISSSDHCDHFCGVFQRSCFCRVFCFFSAKPCCKGPAKRGR